MTLQAELAALDQASQQVGQIRDGLLDEHATLKSQVDDLLDVRWSGEAADQFRTAWAQWCEGMSAVLSGLGLESAAIALTRSELNGTDQDRADAAAMLHQRLSDRLG